MATPRIPRTISGFDRYINSSTEHLGANLSTDEVQEVPAATTRHLLEIAGPKNAEVILTNTGTPPGAATLLFCLSAENTGVCSGSSSVEVAPGETKTTTLWNLGNEPEKVFLNATNPSATDSGHCTVQLFRFSALGLTGEEFTQWKNFRDAWNEKHVIYKSKKPTPQKARVDTALTDEMHRIMEDSIAFIQPLLVRIESSPHATFEDLVTLNIRRGKRQDTEPSPVHGSHLVTGAPYIKLKNIEGAVIDIRFRRTADQTRPSLPKGYKAHISYQIGGTAPEDPEAEAMKEKTSSKARFQLKAGMINLGKKLYLFGRFEHKTNEALNGPWSNLMQITIA